MLPKTTIDDSCCVKESIPSHKEGIQLPQFQINSTKNIQNAFSLFLWIFGSFWRHDPN